MKITSITFLLASLVGSVSAQGDACIHVKTFCKSSDGTPCRLIKQKTKADKCGPQTVTLDAEWCNNKHKRQHITSESALILTGGAIGGKKVLRVPTGDLSEGECDEAKWVFEINNCKPFFNYELNIRTADPHCRGFFFARQMKSLCKNRGEITCTFPDGKSCANYHGPPTKIIAEPHCPIIKCIDQPREKCKQDLAYGFTIKNGVEQPLHFDLDFPNIASSKVAFEPVKPNKYNFRDLPAKDKRSWSETKHNVNTCRYIPSASINSLGNIIGVNSKKKDRDPNYQYCSYFVDQAVRKFDNLPFCCDIGPVGQLPDAGNGGKGKGNFMGGKGNDNFIGGKGKGGKGKGGKGKGGKGKGGKGKGGKGKRKPSAEPSAEPSGVPSLTPIPTPCPGIIPGSPSDHPRADDELYMNYQEVAVA